MSICTRRDVGESGSGSGYGSDDITRFGILRSFAEVVVLLDPPQT
jgi:hypothetical protein